MYLEGSTPLIKIEGGKTTKNYRRSNIIKNTLFQNIEVQTSLFLAQNGLIPLTFDNITMDDIRRKITEDNTADDLQDDNDLPISLCFMGQNYIALNVSQSKFTNINANCIGLKNSALTLKASTFNNTALQHKAIQRGKNGNYGISWISFHAGTKLITPANAIKISSCKFIENKIHPEFGGVYL